MICAVDLSHCTVSVDLLVPSIDTNFVSLIATGNADSKKTSDDFSSLLKPSGVSWNFDYAQFDAGSRCLPDLIAASAAQFDAGSRCLADLIAASAAQFDAGSRCLADLIAASAAQFDAGSRCLADLIAASAASASQLNLSNVSITPNDIASFCRLVNASSVRDSLSPGLSLLLDQVDPELDFLPSLEHGLSTLPFPLKFLSLRLNDFGGPESSLRLSMGADLGRACAAKSLVALDLCGNDLRSEGVCALIENLPPTLRYLGIADNDVDDGAADAMRLLGASPNIRGLDLSMNSLSEGLLQLAVGLASRPSDMPLESIWLCSTDLAECDLAPLFAALLSPTRRAAPLLLDLSDSECPSAVLEQFCRTAAACRDPASGFGFESLSLGLRSYSEATLFDVLVALTPLVLPENQSSAEFNGHCSCCCAQHDTARIPLRLDLRSMKASIGSTTGDRSRARAVARVLCCAALGDVPSAAILELFSEVASACLPRSDGHPPIILLGSSCSVVEPVPSFSTYCRQLSVSAESAGRRLIPNKLLAESAVAMLRCIATLVCEKGSVSCPHIPALLSEADTYYGICGSKCTDSLSLVPLASGSASSPVLTCTGALMYPASTVRDDIRFGLGTGCDTKSDMFASVATIAAAAAAAIIVGFLQPPDSTSKSSVSKSDLDTPPLSMVVNHCEPAPSPSIRPPTCIEHKQVAYRIGKCQKAAAELSDCLHQLVNEASQLHDALQQSKRQSQAIEKSLQEVNASIDSHRSLLSKWRSEYFPF